MKKILVALVIGSVSAVGCGLIKKEKDDDAPAAASPTSPEPKKVPGEEDQKPTGEAVEKKLMDDFIGVWITPCVAKTGGKSSRTIVTIDNSSLNLQVMQYSDNTCKSEFVSLSQSGALESIAKNSHAERSVNSIWKGDMQLLGTHSLDASTGLNLGATCGKTDWQVGSELVLTAEMPDCFYNSDSDTDLPTTLVRTSDTVLKIYDDELLKSSSMEFTKK